MGAMTCSELFQSGGIEAALSRPFTGCICQNAKVCSCMFAKNILFLNLYGISRNFPLQEVRVRERVRVLSLSQ